MKKILPNFSSRTNKSALPLHFGIKQMFASASGSIIWKLCFVLVGFLASINSANAANKWYLNVTSVGATAGSTGLVSSPVPICSTYYSVYGFQFSPVVQSGTGGAGTISQITISNYGTSTQNFSTYYATAYLYSSSNSSFDGTATQVTGTVGVAAGANQNIIFNLPNIAVSTSVAQTTYYYVVLTNSLGQTTARTFELAVSAITATSTSGTYNGFNTTAAGPAYTFSGASTLTAANLTAGLTTPTTIFYGQNNIAVAGISMTMSSCTSTLSQLVFTESQAYTTFQAYFGTPTLVTCPTSTYSSASATVVTPASTSFTGTTLTYNLSSYSLTTTTTYFFLVINYNVSGGALPNTFTFSASSYTSSLSGTAVTTGYAANTYICTAPTVTAADLTAGLTTPTAVYYGQNNIAVAGISLATNYATTASQLVFTVPQSYATLQGYFGTPTLVTCPTATYSAASATTVTPASTSLTGTTLTYNLSSYPITSTATVYFFLVLNYSVAGGSLPQAFNFSPSSYTTAVSASAVTTGYANNTYTCTAPTVTATDLTAGLTAGPAVYYGESNIAVAGISLSSTYATTASQLEFTVPQSYATLEGYFGTPTLVTCPTATYSAAAATTVTPASTSFTGTTLTFNLSSYAITTANTYFFLVFNYNVFGGTLPQTFNFSPLDYTTALSASAVTTGYANNTYTCTAPTITAADLTAGLTAGPAVYYGQTNIAVAGISLKSNYATTASQLEFTVPQSYATLEGYFGTPTLVTCPTATYSAAAATTVTPASTSFTGTTLTFNLSSYAITTANTYFFLVFNYNVYGATLPQTFNFSPLDYTAAGASLVTTGYANNTYTCTAPTITAADLTAGLTAGPAVYYGQTNIAVAGISLKSNYATTASQLEFTVPQSYATLQGYFGTPTLVTCPTATYSAAAATTVTPASTSFTGTTLTFNLSSYAITTANTYFFLVINYSVSGGAVPQTFNFSPLDYTAAGASLVTTGYANNTYTCSSPVLTENIISSTGATGLATNPIAGNQTNIAIWGMSLTSGGTSSVTALSFTASQNITSYFPAVTLYSSTSSTFTTGTATYVATGTISGTSVSFSGLPITIASGVTTYYYLVVSYTESGTTPPASFQFTLASITSSPTATLNTLAGPVYTFSAGTYNWTGALSTAWTTPGNWSPNVVPGSYDVAQIGSATYGTYYQNIPTVSTGTQTVGSVSFNGNQYYSARDGAYYYVEGELLVSTGATLVVNGNISLTGDQEVAEYYIGNDIILAGGGTIQCNNINVNPTYYYKKGYNYFLQMVNDGVTLQVANNIALTSTYDTEPSLYEPIFELAGGTTTVNGVISTTNNNSGTNYGTSVLAFSTGLTAGAPATLNLTNATALSGLSAVGTNTITFNEPYATVAYSASGAQTVYTDAAITGLAAGNISYYDLTFSGSGIKTPNGTSANNLDIAGNFTNSLANDAADYVNVASTIVNLDGENYPNPTTQYIYPGSGNGTSFYNVSVTGNENVTISGGNAYINANGTLNLTGDADVLAAGGLLTLNASSTSCAAVTQITNGCSVTGNVNVQRYISGVRGYRLISSPVYSGNNGTSNVFSIGYLGSYLYLTGTGTGFPHAGNPTLYLYDEGFVPQFSTFLNSNFIGISTLPTTVVTNPTYGVNTNTAGLTGSYQLPVGNGVDVFYRGNALTQTSAALTTPAPLGSFPTEQPTTTTTTGTLNQNQVTFYEWYTPTSTKLGSTSQKFDLVGNPYACAIDLNTMQSTTTTTGIYATKLTGANGVPGFIYELIPTGTYAGQYGVWTVGSTSATATNGASEYIASGEGFFVEATGTSKLIFNESAKASSTNANSFGIMARRMDVAAVNVPGANPLLRLNMSMDSTSAEETVIAFNPSSSTGYVFGEDAPHHTGSGAVNFASRSTDSVAMMINSMPLQQTQTIPLNVYATNDGVYTINMTQPTPLPAIYDVWLKDAYTKDSLDIKHNPTYSFDISNSDANSYGTNRLTLVIRENPALMVHLLSFNAQKQPTGDNVVWSTENEANYTQFAVQRSTDGGKTFVVLDSLMSTAAGAYSYLDHTPVQGANSYRVQLTDLNGVRTYSSVVTIMYGNNANTITLNNMLVYPNPTTGPMNLAINVSTTTGAMAAPSYHIQVTNNMGIVVKNVTSNEQVWQSDMSNLLPGTYFITVTNASTNTQVGKSAFVKL